MHPLYSRGHCFLNGPSNFMRSAELAEKGFQECCRIMKLSHEDLLELQAKDISKVVEEIFCVGQHLEGKDK